MTQRVVPTDIEAVLAPRGTEASPEQVILDSEQSAEEERRRRQVWAAFGALDARCQRLLRVLMATPPLSYSDVAAALDMRVGSIGPTRKRCLARLRKMLTE
jgi:DNA-directed RNA polymerase specialized sigma24 family protein